MVKPINLFPKTNLITLSRNPGKKHNNHRIPRNKGHLNLHLTHIPAKTQLLLQLPIHFPNSHRFLDKTIPLAIINPIPKRNLLQIPNGNPILMSKRKRSFHPSFTNKKQ